MVFIVANNLINPFFQFLNPTHVGFKNVAHSVRFVCVKWVTGQFAPATKSWYQFDVKLHILVGGQLIYFVNYIASLFIGNRVLLSTNILTTKTTFSPNGLQQNSMASM